MTEKIENSTNNKVLYFSSSTNADENKPICLADYLFSKNDEQLFDYDRMRRFGEDTFTTRIGGTTYEVSTHFNPKGTQSVMEQFKRLILSESLI